MSLKILCTNTEDRMNELKSVQGNRGKERLNLGFSKLKNCTLVGNIWAKKEGMWPKRR